MNLKDVFFLRCDVEGTEFHYGVGILVVVVLRLVELSSQWGFHFICTGREKWPPDSLPVRRVAL